MKVLYDENHYLKEGETVLYSKKAGKAYFPTAEVIVGGILVALTLAFDGFMVGSNVTGVIMKANKLYEALLFIAALFVHLVPIGVWFVNILKKIAFTKSGYILITNKKAALICYGDETEIKAVFYDNVSAVTAEKDKLCFTLADGKFIVKGIENAQEIKEKIESLPD